VVVAKTICIGEKIIFMQHSEFRKDIVSGDWILIVPGRAKKPGDFKQKKEKRKIAPFHTCRFEHPFENIDEHIILGYARTKKGDIKTDWDLLVLKNKYPAVTHSEKKAPHHTSKFFELIPGVGHHDLIITRDHKKNFPELSSMEAFRVFSAFRDRYLMLFQDKNIQYISMFHNWGHTAGASIFHPHYQMIGIPVVSSRIFRTLCGAHDYFVQHKKCVFCAMIAEEKKYKKRIIAENEYAIALTPYASRHEFEVKVFPKKHSAYFENTLDVEMEGVTKLLQQVLRKMKKNLGDPDYNFFIHTTPVFEKTANKNSFHWHVEARPVWNIAAGFEFDTGVEINVVDPDFAAEILRK